MLKELLKPRSYDAAQKLKEGDYAQGIVGVLTATTLRSIISFVGMKAVKIETDVAVKASISANIAVSASVLLYYMLDD